MKQRLAVIGASSGQLPLCLKAKEKGIETFCFAWPEGAVCRDFVDHFIPISIMEMDEIVEYCRTAGVDGVVSNASETTAAVTVYVAEKLGKNGTPHDAFTKIQDKSYVRERTNILPEITPVEYKVGSIQDILGAIKRPFVMKPIKGASKLGVNYIEGNQDIPDVPDNLKDAVFMAEEYIHGEEYSVESLSFHGSHHVIQVTEKISSGPPHFVELEHHQPALLSQDILVKIREAVSEILISVGYTDGASHIEIKINGNDIYLVEVNPRGGGDMISNRLIELSTDYDYLGHLIDISLDSYENIKPHNIACSGIYFLTASTSRLLPYFKGRKEDWMVERVWTGKELTQARSNYDHDGYIIYKSDKKIIL